MQKFGRKLVKNSMKLAVTQSLRGTEWFLIINAISRQGSQDSWYYSTRVNKSRVSLTVQNVCNVQHNQVKTVDNKHVRIYTFHPFKTDQKRFSSTPKTVFKNVSAALNVQDQKKIKKSSDRKWNSLLW